MDLLSSRLYYREHKTLIQVLESMQAVMIHIMHLLNFLTKLSRIIMDIKKLINTLAIWITLNWFAHLLIKNKPS